MSFIQQYKKAVVGALGVVLSAVLAALVGDAHIDFSEFVNIIILAAGAVSLGVAPNVPGSRYVKAILAAVAAAATVLVSVYSGGVSTTEWVQIAVAAGTAAGVFKARNVGDYFDKVGKHRANV